MTLHIYRKLAFDHRSNITNVNTVVPLISRGTTFFQDIMQVLKLIDLSNIN